MRFGTVAIVGQTNVGKSTFLNRALGTELAIVSPLPQTTRDTVLGVWHSADAQIAFVDTPGLHRPHTELGRRMNAQAVDAARTADVILFVADARPPAQRVKGRPKSAPTELISPEDRQLLGRLPPGSASPCVLLLNKVDLVKDKSQLLPIIGAFSEAHQFAAIIPTSVLKPDGSERVLKELVLVLPEGPAGYDASTLTDRPATFFAREYVREQILLSTGKEVPHAVAVSIERVEESKQRLLVQATIHVEKVGQRKILVGAGGEGIRNIGTKARKRLEELLEKKVRLELYVRVSPSWKNMPRQLAELGYAGSPLEGALANPFDADADISEAIADDEAEEHASNAEPADDAADAVDGELSRETHS